MQPHCSPYSAAAAPTPPSVAPPTRSPPPTASVRAASVSSSARAPSRRRSPVRSGKGGDTAGGSADLVAVREAQLAVELVGVVEAEDTLGLAGEVLLRPDHEPALGVACEDALEVAMRSGSDWSGFVLALSFFLRFFWKFWGFGDEEGGGELGGREEGSEKVYDLGFVNCCRVRKFGEIFFLS